jgi:hypothetical protein
MAATAFFWTLSMPHKCYCSYCIEGMVEAGLDPANDEDADDYGYRVLQKYFEQTTAACKRKNRSCASSTIRDTCPKARTPS